MDVFDKKTRSMIMSKIRAKDTKPEIKLRKSLFALGFRYRIHVKTLPGTPDIVLKRYKTVIFVNGCFWHGHSCRKREHVAKSNIEFWDDKILKNRLRDIQKQLQLINMGWNIIIVWECQIKTKRMLESKSLEIAQKLKRRQTRFYERVPIPERYDNRSPWI